MKLYVVHKDTVIIYSLIAVFIISILTLNWDTAVSVFEVMAPKRDLPIYCVQKEEKICAISFDAAWGNEDTHSLIEILKKYNIKTTFFVVGEWVDKYPESVKELSDAGHEIMNHSNTHPHMTSLSKENMKKEVEECNKKIESVINKKPILFRPPYGDYNDSVVGAMRDIGMYTIQWDVDSLDWKDLDAQTIVNRVTTKVKPGSIVLFHNAAKNTPEALPLILEKLIADGYKIVPVSEIIYKENFTVDPTGRQIPNSVATGSID
ncbi:MAG: deacetylase [Ruminococcaceae bacterium]|nr:deacetylase [Oscillospiraceae bacterium]